MSALVYQRAHTSYVDVFCMPLFVKNFELTVDSGLNFVIIQTIFISICPQRDLAYVAHIIALFYRASSFNSLLELISFVKQVSGGC